MAKRQDDVDPLQRRGEPSSGESSTGSVNEDVRGVANDEDDEFDDDDDDLDDADEDENEDV